MCREAAKFIFKSLAANNHWEFGRAVFFCFLGGGGIIFDFWSDTVGTFYTFVFLIALKVVFLTWSSNFLDLVVSEAAWWDEPSCSACVFVSNSGLQVYSRATGSVTKMLPNFCGVSIIWQETVNVECVFSLLLYLGNVCVIWCHAFPKFLCFSIPVGCVYGKKMWSILRASLHIVFRLQHFFAHVQPSSSKFYVLYFLNQFVADDNFKSCSYIIAVCHAIVDSDSGKDCLNLQSCPDLYLLSTGWMHFVLDLNSFSLEVGDRSSKTLFDVSPFRYVIHQTVQCGKVPWLPAKVVPAHKVHLIFPA